MMQRISSSTLLLLAGLILSALLSTLTGCTLLPTNRSRVSLENEPTPTPIPTPIVPIKPTYRVQRGEVVKEVEFRGQIGPVVEEDVFFRQDGHVRNIYVREDETVTAGQVLADLEIDPLERDLVSSKLELERAQAALAAAERELANDLRRAEVELELARLNLAETRDQDLTPRQTKAATDLEKAAIELQRAQESYDEIAWRNDRTASEQAKNLQQATLNYTEAEAEYELALQEIDNHQYEVARQELQIKLAQIRLDELNEGVDPMLKADLQRAELNVQKLEADIAESQLIAPFDGQLLTFNLTEGRAVEAFKPVAIVADLADLEISANLATREMQDLAEGFPALINPSNNPGQTLEGVIRRMPYPYGGGGRSDPLDEENPDESTRVTLSVPPRQAGYEADDWVKVTVVIERKVDVLWLPPAAIRTFSGRRFVVVQDGELQRRVDVTIGLESEERVEIESGLVEGQVVVGE